MAKLAWELAGYLDSTKVEGMVESFMIQHKSSE
jgi:hypothetical protein